MKWENDFLIFNGGILGFVTQGHFGWSSIHTHKNKIPALLGIFTNITDARAELERFSLEMNLAEAKEIVKLQGGKYLKIQKKEKQNVRSNRKNKRG